MTTSTHRAREADSSRRGEVRRFPLRTLRAAKHRGRTTRPARLRIRVSWSCGRRARARKKSPSVPSDVVVQPDGRPVKVGSSRQLIAGTRSRAPHLIIVPLEISRRPRLDGYAASNALWSRSVWAMTEGLRRLPQFGDREIIETEETTGSLLQLVSAPLRCSACRMRWARRHKIVNKEG